MTEGQTDTHRETESDTHTHTQTETETETERERERETYMPLSQKFAADMFVTVTYHNTAR